ncbi:MAG: tyrosine-type recombinase/integrase [Clostridia bacterium]
MAIKKMCKNKWKLILEKGIDSNGNRIRVCETIEGLKADAETRYAQMKVEIKGGYYIENKKITMEKLLNDWVESRKIDISPKTYNTYKIYIKNIVKCIGHIELLNINPKLLEDFYLELKTNTKYASKTILTHYNIVNASLNKAVIWGYIVNNPNLRVSKPKVQKKEIVCYSPNEVHELISVLQDEPLKYQALIYLALDSGARRGEIIALNWNDINFIDGSIKITKSVQYTPEKGIFEKNTKTENSVRKVYISDTTVAILKKYQNEQLRQQLLLGSKWLKSDRVFTTEYGAVMHPDSAGNILERVTKKYNLKRINFHALRHTSISLMIASGIQVQVISRKAGHSSVQTTDRIYSHFFEDEFKDTADKMNQFLQVK